MKINSLNNTQSFGKTPMMLCSVKKAQDNQKVSATLYKMNPRNSSDLKDVLYSKNTGNLRRDMQTDATLFNPRREYFVLSEDKTGEVISCAETSKHYRTGDEKVSGFYTLIEEFNGNSNYINSTEPMFAFLADKAVKAYNTSMVIGTSDAEESELKKARFTRTKNGEWYMPERRFTQLIDNAEKRYDMIV